MHVVLAIKEGKLSDELRCRIRVGEGANDCPISVGVADRNNSLILRQQEKTSGGRPRCSRHLHWCKESQDDVIAL